MDGYNQTKKASLSVTPMVHRRNHQLTATAGGFNQKIQRHMAPSKDVGSHLRIAPSARYDVKDGFGEMGPQTIREFPRLLAPEHLFVPPPPPEVIQTDEREVQTDPQLFKKQLESIQDYQDWLNGTVDPFLKDLKMEILQSKPDNLLNFVLAYVNCLETKVKKPVTVDQEEYEMNLRAEARRVEQEARRVEQEERLQELKGLKK